MPGKYPYTYSVEKLPTLLHHIREAGPPPALSQSYLAKAGFASSNDRSLIPVLKFVGLLDSKSVPTPEYSSYRDETTGDSLLASLIRAAYAGLFDMYGNAQDRDDAALKNFFRKDAEVSDKVAARMMSTFRALCKAASFDGGESQVTLAPKENIGSEVAHDGGGRSPRRSSKVDVCVNVQVMIPESADASMIDNIFKSMATHLGISE